MTTITRPTISHDELIAAAKAIKITRENVNEYLGKLTSAEITGPETVALLQFLVDSGAAQTAHPLLQGLIANMIKLGLVEARDE